MEKKAQNQANQKFAPFNDRHQYHLKLVFFLILTVESPMGMNNLIYDSIRLT
ncbi:hypothetical protein BFG60_0112 [Microcystis aeruginosa NIES-98]|jgi:hypothetical protein|nr:hypothetical protein BFG60_0112 [Microcystis aeruginosa NIES-98]